MMIRSIMLSKIRRKSGAVLFITTLIIITGAFVLLAFTPLCLMHPVLTVNRMVVRRLLSLHSSVSSYHQNNSNLTSTDRGVHFSSKDESFMHLALRQAQHAYREGEVPIGAIVVSSDGVVLSASRNRIEASNDATAHAEIDCMRKVSKLINNWRLVDCTLYSTLEPCAMCLSAMQSFRIKRIIYGANDNRLGACGSWIDLGNMKHPFHKIEISGGLLASESSLLLRRFFQSKRMERKNSSEYMGDAATAADEESLSIDRGSILDLI